MHSASFRQVSPQEEQPSTVPRLHILCRLSRACLDLPCGMMCPPGMDDVMGDTKELTPGVLCLARRGMKATQPATGS
eukprot:240909-Amphidinium_carterae.1